MKHYTSLGHCTSAVDYISEKGLSSVEILGVAKAMNDAGEKLVSLQSDVDFELEKIDSDKLKLVQEKSEEIKVAMKNNSLDFFW